MSQNSSRNALRRGHGFASTAGLTADAGKYKPKSSHHTRDRRIARGECPGCGGPADPEGYVNCAPCRAKHVIQNATALARRQQREAEQMKTLMAERLQGVDEINTAKRLLDQRPTAKILVVGGRTTNLQRDARSHPRVICWESTTMSKTGTVPIMPSAAAVVIVTRFCGHNVTESLKKQVADRHAFMFGGLKQTGEVRHILSFLLDLKPVPAVVTDIIANPTSDFEPDTEQDALVEVETPVKDSTLALVQAAAASPSPVLIDRPSPLAAPPPSNDAQLEMRLDEAVRLVTESLASLANAAQALALVRDELTRTKAVIHANSEQLDTLRKLKALLGNL